MTDLASLCSVLERARRGVLIRACAAQNPPAVLILDCADHDHALAIADYVTTFDPATVGGLLDELEALRATAPPARGAGPSPSPPAESRPR